MTIEAWKNESVKKLEELYPPEEALNITKILVEAVTGLNKASQVLSKHNIIDKENLTALNEAMTRLLNHEPLQYVLGQAWFYGLDLHVMPGVLIPRRETEELVDWVVQYCKPGIRVLDIGTGSGCIPLAVKTVWPDSEITAWDVQEKAVEVTRKNARKYGMDIKIEKKDIFSASKHPGKWDIIVSNPPYVTNAEKSRMRPNVLDYEPETALFVEDTNPLVYYKTIAGFALNHLAEGGLLFFEINEHYPEETLKLLKEAGFADTELRRDMQGKPRMVKAAVS
ncbi:MAG: peptide chain release factor N(5)-glutamine methyltransferase [Bacteroidota bacterium]